MDASITGGLLGGLGLFLLGMHLMTTGLRLAAGKRLSLILHGSTKTRLRGVLSGILITSLVQSSSATTVATLGFVNASLINLRQAVAVIYGSNIGTTTTAWLVTLIGFNVDIKIFALPAIGLGMLARLLAKNKALGFYGEAIAGFGVFFLGIEILKNAFGGLGSDIQFSQLNPNGLGIIWLVGIGFSMTLLMQSSSAAMAIILTAVGGGVIPYEVAAAMIIGANVGTTSTAILGVIGATPNAKRAATAHVAFNLITGIIALTILPFMLNFSLWVQVQSGLDSSPMVILAVFHTLFNLLGVTLMWPLTDRLVDFLDGRFRSHEEDISNPRYLDSTLLDTPTLALDALKEELGRIGAITRSAAKAVISAEQPADPQFRADKHTINKLMLAAGDFSTNLQRNNLPEEIAESLPDGMRISGYYNNVMEMVEDIAKLLLQRKDIADKALSEQLSQFRSAVVKLINLADPIDEKYNHVDYSSQLTLFETDYQNLKSHLLRSGTTGKVSARTMVHELEILSHMHRLIQQLEKATHYLSEFGLKPVPIETQQESTRSSENI